MATFEVLTSSNVISPGGGGVQSVSAGTNVTITGTATNPIVNATGGGSSYLVYSGLIFQTGTDVPVITEKENTTGATFTWFRSSSGSYYVQANSNLWPTVTDLWGSIEPCFTSALLFSWNAANEVGIGSVSAIADGDLYYIPFEIRIY
jgi:hypothetical protein